MGALVTLIFLTTFSLTLGQLIVPQDITIEQQQGTLSGLTQFGAKGSGVINGLASPQELLVASLAPSHHESRKSNTIKKKFPVAPTSDLLGVADVQKPKEVTNQGKPPDLINKQKFSPLPLGVDFLGTSISSQEIIEMTSRGDKKGQGLVAPRSWKNLVKSNPRQVGDRFDIVIEKRMNGNELSPSAKNSKPKEIRPIKDVPINNAKSFLHEPELPWLNAAVELTPEHTWTENTIVRSSIGPMEMAEISTNAVKVRKAKLNSNVNEIMKTTASNALYASSTPNPVAAMNSNTETHVTNSFHLKTTNKKPVAPSAVGWTSWVEPVATATSPAWFEGQQTVPDITTDGKLITGSEVNSLYSPTEVTLTKEKKTTPKPVINDLPVELPTANVLQKPKSKGFFASWSPWTGTHEQTTHQNVAFTDSINTGQQETVPMSPVTSSTILRNAENAHKDINSDLGNQIFIREQVKNVQNTENVKQGINSDLDNQLTNHRELVNYVQNTEIANQDINSDLGNHMVDRELANKVQNAKFANQGINSDLGNQMVNRELGNNVQSTENANPGINLNLGNQIVNRELVNNVHNTENANPGINSDLGNQIVNQELANIVQNTEKTNQGINSDLGNQIVNRELVNNVHNTENANPGINSDLDNQIVNQELANIVQNTEKTNQGINSDLENKIVNRELVNNVHNTENANPGINSDLGNQTVNQELANIVQNTEKTNKGINSDLDNQIVNQELVNNVANAAPDKQIVSYADIENVVKNLAGKETANPELLNEVLTAKTGRQEVNTEVVKQAVSTVLEAKSTKLEVANQATASKILESLDMLNSNTLPSDVLKGVREPKHSKSKSPFDTLNTSQKKAEQSANTTNEIVKGNITEEITMSPASNFDPILLPPAISAGARHGFQQEENGQSSNVQFGVSYSHLGTSSNTALDHNELTGSLPSLGRSGESHPKRRFFVSPSPSDLIPPQEHLHEGILFPIEPHFPSAMLDKKHSTSYNFANVNQNLDQGTIHSLSHKGHVDMINPLTGHKDITSEKVPLQPQTTGNSLDKMHSTNTIKSRKNANSIWNTRSEITDSNPAEFVRSDKLATSKDEAKERNVLLEQIREALFNLNGNTAIMKPLDGMNLLPNDPGLTHALIGSVNGFANIPRTVLGNTVTTDVGVSASKRADNHDHHHSLEKHIDKSLFNDHNSFHREHSLTDLSGHITLDEKAIRQKLLSPDTSSTFNHFPSHEGHNTHASFHRNQMGLTDSLSRADVDLSQDLSNSPMLNTPITIRNMQRHIEETNRESAKLRFFTNPKNSENFINRKNDPKSKRKEERNKQKEVEKSQQPTTTQIPSTKPTEENGIFINNNSIFFDPDTNRPVDPFNNVSSDVLRNAHHAWEDAVANVKTHIDPIPEIAAVVGDKKNAIRVGSVSAFRVGEIPPSLNQPQPPQDPNAAFHFLDPVTNDVVPIAALPDVSSNNNAQEPNPHQPHVPDISQMFGHALSNGAKPTIPFINPMASAGDMNSEDGFFVGPILFGPVEDPPPNGEIEISGPVLAMGISPGDNTNGNHGPQGIDMKKILQGIFKNNNNQQHKTKINTFNSPFSSIDGSSNRTASKLTHANGSKPKTIKPVSLGRHDINPLQQMLGGSKQTSMLPSTHFPVDSSLGHRTSTHTSKQRLHAPHDPDTQPRKGISKKLWNALVNILKANKRKEFLSKQKVSTSFQKSFPSTVRKNNIIQRPAQMQSNKPNKIDIQKIINLVKARQKLFGLKKKLTATQTMKKHHTMTGISKSPLGGRSQIPNRSVMKPIASTKHEPMPTLRSSAPIYTNSERLEHFQNKRYQLLLHLMKNRRLKNNHMMTNVPNIRSNLRPSHINSVARPAQRTIGHSSVNTDRHRFIPKLNSAHRSSVVRPIPLSTIHQWPFSAPVASQHSSMNTQHFLPRHRVWPQNQIQH
ncbi:uncharacterized protein LOC110445631 isoform X2 [Mizuhopecten yessoensis]|uniref:uncharacterized protein LOC110445631 isoform X2 n=1 Tax=Mizuhopecten yessoensis TaxID=6573 RepID=UPI000B45DEBB|nr:uncharacterized protein LOC110445631 isoform X2 [Mizuhopecten yessoensis]